MVSVIDTGVLFTDLCDGHADWSQKTFGSDQERGPEGPLKHLVKEANEALEALYELADFVDIEDHVAATAAEADFREELADCLLLILDASRRAKMSGPQLLQAAMKKLEKNRGRKWGAASATEPVEHVE